MILGRLPSVQIPDYFIWNLPSCTLQPKTVFGTMASRKKTPENKHELSHYYVYKDK